MFRNVAAAIDGSFAGGAYVLTAANDGITYAPFHDAMISAEAAATVEAVRAGLADGSLTPADAVPEPSTLVLAAMALLGLGYVWRRHNC